jgi:hypothetical protein
MRKCVLETKERERLEVDLKASKKISGVKLFGEELSRGILQGSALPRWEADLIDVSIKCRKKAYKICQQLILIMIKLTLLRRGRGHINPLVGVCIISLGLWEIASKQGIPTATASQP